MGANSPEDLSMTAPKWVYAGWNNVVLFPLFSSPSPTIMAITSYLSVCWSSVSLTLNEMLAS